MLDWLTLHLLALLATSLIAGGMFFFSIIFAPLVFTKLPQAQASTFIRGVFPRYYSAIVFGSITALAAMAASLVTYRLESITMAAVAVTAILARRLLLRVDTLRELATMDDQTSKRQFNHMHRMSVFMNVAKFVGVMFVLVRLSV